MAEVIIDYQKIVNYIGKEIQHVWDELVVNGSDEIKTLVSAIKSIEISDEQFFRKQESNRKLRRGTVYLVVRFSAGAINYASSVTPVSIYGLGVANQVKPVQVLLGTFASYWTTKNVCQNLTTTDANNQIISLEVPDMLQVWNTPEVVSNFNVVDDDFRNLYRVTGNIVIGPAAIRVGTLTYYYNTDGFGEKSETINIMAFQDNLHTNMDSQPFGDTNGFAQSEANFSTYVFSISTYLLNSQLARDLQAMRGFRYRPNGVYTIDSYDEQGNPKFSIADTNKRMKLKIDFTNGFNNMPFKAPTTRSEETISVNFEETMFVDIGGGDYQAIFSSEMLPDDIVFSSINVEDYSVITEDEIDLTSKTVVTFNQTLQRFVVNISHASGPYNGVATIKYSFLYKNEQTSSDPVKGDDFYMYYKVVDSSIKQEIGGIPALTVSFTR